MKKILLLITMFLFLISGVFAEDISVSIIPNPAYDSSDLTCLVDGEVNHGYRYKWRSEFLDNYIEQDGTDVTGPYLHNSLTQVGDTITCMVFVAAYNYFVPDGWANIEIAEDVELTYGCKDPNAFNYDPNVDVHDESLCVYVNFFSFGCTDPSANNYNENAIIDDGSCEYSVYDFDPEEFHIRQTEFSGVEFVVGCKDPLARNYNPYANLHDQSLCEYFYFPYLERGCTDPSANNYNENAIIDDGSCEYSFYVIVGCKDPLARNYNPLATVHDESLCEYYEIPEPPIVLTIYGCTDPEALNYNCFAIIDDGSCEYEVIDVIGCMDVNALNYNQLATVHNQSLCEYGVEPDINLTESGSWPRLHDLELVNFAPINPKQYYVGGEHIQMYLKFRNNAGVHQQVQVMFMLVDSNNIVQSMSQLRIEVEDVKIFATNIPIQQGLNPGCYTIKAIVTDNSGISQIEGYWQIYVI